MAETRASADYCKLIKYFENIIEPMDKETRDELLEMGVPDWQISDYINTSVAKDYLDCETVYEDDSRNWEEKDPFGGVEDESDYHLGGANEGPPSTGTPRAIKIFRNSSLTQENWQIIEDMLDKITNDCMGSGLYNEIVDVLDGKTVIIKFSSGSNGSFDPQSGTITIGQLHTESNVLFHEMMHLFQAYNETADSEKESSLNHEFEAYYAQYLYLSNMPDFKGGETEKYWLINPERLSCALLRDDFLDEKGNLLPGKTETDLNKYIKEILVETIFSPTKPADETISTWREIYPYYGKTYDSNRIGTTNFSNLRKITKEC